MPTSLVKTPRDERLWQKAKDIADEAAAVMLPVRSGIYSIRNTVNGKVYIGKSVNIAGRWRSHRSCLRRGVHVNPHLQRAWCLYGESAFRCEVLHEESDISLLPTLEAKYVSDFNATDEAHGYNLNVVSGDSYRASPETRAKQSAAQKNRNRTHPRTCTPEQRARMSAAQRSRCVVVSDETRAKMSASGKGKPKSPEHRAAIGASRIGLIQSAETRAKIGAAHKGRKASDETRAKMSETRRGRKRGPYRKKSGNMGTDTMNTEWGVG